MTATNTTAKELTDSVANQIAERLKLEPNTVINKLVASLTKNLLKASSVAPVIKPQDTQAKIPQQTIIQKPLDVIKPETEQKSLNKKEQPPALKTPLSQQTKKDEKLKSEKPKSAPLPKVSGIQTKLLEAIQEFADSKKENKKENPDYSESQQSVFEKQNTVLFDGFTDKGLTKLKEELPEIIKKGVSDLFPKTAESKKEEAGKPGGSLLSGLGILSGLAGLLTLLYGLSTDSPFKGLSKLAATGLLKVSGFTKMFDGVAKKMVRYLIKLPKTLLGKFTKAISGMLGKGTGSALIKTGLSKLSNFLPKFLAGALKFLKKVPFFGSLISLGFAVSRFNSGDVVGGGIEVLSGIAGLFPGIGTGISFALDALNAFLDLKAGGSNKEASGKKLNIIGEFAGKIGSWLKEKLIDVPIIGPLIKSVTHLVEGDIMKGIKQLAYVVPAFEFIGAMLGDSETTAVASVAAGGVKQVWEWTKEIGATLWKKMQNAPVIGPAIKGFKQIFEEGNVVEGLATMAKGITDLNPLKWLIDWIAGPETVNTAISNTAGVIKNGLQFANDIKNKLLRKVLEFIPEKFLGISLRSRVAEWMGIDMSAASDEPVETNQTRDVVVPSSAKSESNTSLTEKEVPPLPAEQNSILKQQAINEEIKVAPPAKTEESSTDAAKASVQSPIKSDDILEQIAKNTNDTNAALAGLANGFAALAQALEKMGTAILEKPESSPVIVNQQSSQQNPTVRSTQAAKSGNKKIAQFRQAVELMRQQPA